MTRAFRALDETKDRAAVRDLLERAQDYVVLWKNRAVDDSDVDFVFSAAPPNCDPKQSYRAGLYLDDVLSGVAELSFGFPEPKDAYLGLMLLDPAARNAGHGAAFTDHLLAEARRRSQAQQIYLAVLDRNPKGLKFWTRMGFEKTGIRRQLDENGFTQWAERMVRPLER